MRTSLLISSYVIASAISGGKITFNVTEFFIFMAIFLIMDSTDLILKIRKGKSD
ncbi:MAG: hypothetical protein ACJ75J_04215 [Cytophagaceae bacterium]